MSKTTPPRDVKLLSIVVPVFNEQAALPHLQERLDAMRKRLSCSSELLLVDDGSIDQSHTMLLEWARQDRTVKVIRFSRNFGHQAAITAGLDYSTGDTVVVMDADLQDPPELVARMLEKYKEGYEVVYAQRVKRHGESFCKRTAASLFYWLMKRFVHPGLPEEAGDFRLMSRSVANAMRGMRESHRFLRGMTTWVGFPQTAVTFERAPRIAGETKYSLRKMVGLALDAMFSFSSRPLRFAIYLGLCVLLFGIGYSLYTLVRKYLLDDLVPGWATLVILQSIIGGTILVSLGMIGEYVGRIYEEIKQRPLYIVEDTLNLSSPHKQSRVVFPPG